MIGQSWGGGKVSHVAGTFRLSPGFRWYSAVVTPWFLNLLNCRGWRARWCTLVSSGRARCYMIPWHTGSGHRPRSQPFPASKELCPVLS